MNIGIIFAGGVGKRCKNTDLPKQFVHICSKPIIIHTLEYFENHPEIDKIYISILPDYKNYLINLLKKYNITKVFGIADGGETGQDSIYNALKLAAKENPSTSIVLIHDGVRPFITNEIISDNIKCVKYYGNAITTTPCNETILISDNNHNPKIVPARRSTFAAQAPQSFYLGEILEAHEKIRKRKDRYKDIVDSCTLYNYLGRITYMVVGNIGNIKITNEEDLFLLEALFMFRRSKSKLQNTKTFHNEFIEV